MPRVLPHVFTMPRDSGDDKVACVAGVARGRL